MSDTPTSPRPGAPYEIPEEGSLGLLAVGYRGLEAWRAQRDPAWLDQRKAQYDAAIAEAEAEKAAKEAEEAANSETPNDEATEGGS